MVFGGNEGCFSQKSIVLLYFLWKIKYIHQTHVKLPVSHCWNLCIHLEKLKEKKENCGHQDGASGKGTCCQDPCLSAAPMGGRENWPCFCTDVWLRLLTAPVEDPGSVPSTHIVAHTACNYSSRDSDGLLHIGGAQTHTKASTHTRNSFLFKGD